MRSKRAITCSTVTIALSSDITTFFSVPIQSAEVLYKFSHFGPDFSYIFIANARVNPGKVIDDVEGGKAKSASPAAFLFTDGFAAIRISRSYPATVWI